MSRGAQEKSTEFVSTSRRRHAYSGGCREYLWLRGHAEQSTIFGRWLQRLSRPPLLVRLPARNLSTTDGLLRTHFITFMQLSEKTCLIVGASGTIGRTTAKT